MKKLLGVTLVVFVAVSSAVLPLWLTPTAVLADSNATIQFQTVAQTPANGLMSGQPIIAGQVGRVHEVYVHEGQRVRQGQVLFKLIEKLPSVPQQQLRARLGRQELAYAALLAQQPTVLELAAARQQLADTRQQLSRLVPMLSFVYVTAPADGLITRPTARPGDQLTSHTPVATLVTQVPTDTTLLLTSVE